MRKYLNVPLRKSIKEISGLNVGSMNLQQKLLEELEENKIDIEVKILMIQRKMQVCVKDDDNVVSVFLYDWFDYAAINANPRDLITYVNLNTQSFYIRSINIVWHRGKIILDAIHIPDEKEVTLEMTF
jgi:hypothetical protein